MADKSGRDAYARFNALVEVAVQEGIKYEKDMELEAKERNLRRNLSVFLELLNETEKKNSSIINVSNVGTDQKLEISSLDHEKSLMIKKGKRSVRKGRTNPSNTCREVAQKPSEFEGNHDQEKDDGSAGDIIIIKNSPKRLLSSVMDEGDMPPMQEKAKKANNVDQGEIFILPEAFKAKIKNLGGSESTIIFVFQKILTPTDVNAHQSRLLIPFNQVENHGFFTNEEKEKLAKKNSTRDEKQINAILIDPQLDECQINLSRRDMRKHNGKASLNYSLLTQWRKVVEKNKLKAGHVVQLWGFRNASQLGLALVVV